MRIFLLFLSLLILGCQEDVALRNPQPKDVSGQWESLSAFQLFPYAFLEFKSDGTGFIVMSTHEDEVLLAKLDSFVSEAESFKITLTDLEEIDPIPEVYIGSIRRGQLCFTEESFKGEKTLYVCFTKASEIENLRQKAQKRLSKHLDKNA